MMSYMSYNHIKIRFHGDFAEVAEGREAFFLGSVYNKLYSMYAMQASLENMEAYEGSIIVEFDLRSNDLEEVTADLYEHVMEGLEVTYDGVTVTTDGTLYVNGEPYGMVNFIHFFSCFFFKLFCTHSW